MDWSGILIFVHILLLVFWLGTDVGVFVLGKFAQNPAYSVDQRLLLLKVALILDMFPRVCVVLILPTGYQIAVNLGFIPSDHYVTAMVWGFSLVWLGVVLTGLARHDHRIGVMAKKVEKLILILLVLILFWVGGASLINGVPVAAPWLAAKIVMYSLILVFMLSLEKVFLPVVSSFEKLARGGSSTDLEKQIRNGMDRTYIWVLAIYAMVLASAYLGVLQPEY